MQLPHRSIQTIPMLDAHAVLKRHGLRPNSKLGQNFLQSPEALEAITFAAGIRPTDTVLEIGPGLGSLTRYLALSAQQVVAVELDPNLLAPLQAVLAPYPNTRVVPGDILELPISDLVSADEYLVVANIPYYITSAIIRHLLESRPRPRRIVLTIQKEVAERICEEPGDLSLLALSVQVYGTPSITARIPAEAFFPAPQVDSAVLLVDIHTAPQIAPALLPTFFRLIKAGFSQKRKTLRNSLSAGLHISAQEAEALLGRAGIDSKRRAETLSIPEWSLLVDQLKPTG